MQVSIACNMGGASGGGGGGASEHPLKERRASAQCRQRLSVKGEGGAVKQTQPLLGCHAHMKDALGRHSNMKYR
ncbi:hypothetical protein GBF38_004901 [Nibea albiflora]|uniref:Uncharacterized protein n=1 Tax=Nibea albiflora TaxID=240163 RepID=A0ACB7EVL6_NIBAL|nr:hypothetical protein GBF38_004901 [Nibea albiflora]